MLPFILALLLSVSAQAEDAVGPSQHPPSEHPLRLGPLPAGLLPSRTPDLSACLTRTGALANTPLPPGQWVFQLTIRRGQARLVSVAQASPGLEPLSPCIQTTLASIDWGVRKGTFSLPVLHAPAK
jgi:hypothetical protein